jgi:ribosomal protein S18 acetylase RimI-like enzyme
MYSIVENNQNFPSFDYWDFQVEFRINKGLHCFGVQSLSQIFLGENISVQRAIEQQAILHCFIDMGERFKGDFLNVGSVSLTWDPEDNACYIGNLWIEPEFRGNGLATGILNEIINFADELGIVLTLHVLPFISPEKKPTDKDVSKLKAFYQRFGFKTTSEKEGMIFGCLMKRIPRNWPY